jgi:hypothetical protein
MRRAKTSVVLTLIGCAIVVAGFARSAAQTGAARAGAHKAAGSAPPAVTAQLVQRGRMVMMTHACGECHGGMDNPSADGWLAGVKSPDMEFKIGPCAVKPDATPCFTTRPRNLTPDNATGIGRFSERQIFNALRYGLRPEDTPDVVITSMTPGRGNFPANPHYLAPPMPWPSWRHMPDADLWAVAAYLKYGVKAVRNKVADSEGPPDFWASEYTVEKIGAYPAKPFPTANEAFTPVVASAR